MINSEDSIRAATPTSTVPGDWPRNATRVEIDRDLLVANGIYTLNATDPRARPFVHLRSQVLDGLEGLGGRILAVTSASAANGKSHVAANLACALSRVRETALIDLHLRRPVISDRFGLPSIEGLGSFLRSKDDQGQIELRVEGERLAIHAAGPQIEETSDLMMSPRLGALFAQVHRDPDEPVCIVDTPPILEGDDMLLIAKHVDGVLLVIEEGRTTRAQVIESLRLLNGTPILGTLLNKAMDPLAALHR